MKRMGIQALYRNPSMSKPTPDRIVYHYLLRKLELTCQKQVWVMYISCIPLARGFVYLVADLDCLSRRVLAWQLSATLETGPYIEALNEVTRHDGEPEMMNTD